MPKISIIIRTKNEERWIGHCLKMIQKQTISDYEIILVDNASTDNTISVAKRHGIDRLVQVDPFKPGHALNEGIRASSGEYITCLSAHCIPKDEYWLNNLLKNFSESEGIAGVYGRQLPVSFTDPVDKRDLLIVFGLDKRIQVKDYFFHNANSMILRDVWEKYPFDEEVTNIEDRVWGKKVIQSGYRLIYEPEASVYHHHGLHQGNNPDRAKGVVSILEKVDESEMNQLPLTMRPEESRNTAIIPLLGDWSQSNKRAHKALIRCIEDIECCDHINNIVVLAHQDPGLKMSSVMWLKRNSIYDSDSMSLDQLFYNVQLKLEDIELYSDILLYVNPEYSKRPSNLLNSVINEIINQGLDTVFPAIVDYGNYWYKGDNNKYVRTNKKMSRRQERSPHYKALYGLGTASMSYQVRKKSFIGNNVGIHSLDESEEYKREYPSKNL